MAELPELTILECQMDETLSRRTIIKAEVLQEKCLNVPPDQFAQSLAGRKITSVTKRGKWLYIHLNSDLYILLNLGMGADLWHHNPGDALPEKYHLNVKLDDGSGFTCRFWWFGYIRLFNGTELLDHKETAKLGLSPMDINAAEFVAIAECYPRSTIKSFILDQEKISGIGNAYAHDILWKTKLHPKRKLSTLSYDDLRRCYTSIREIVVRAIEMGGLETDFFNQGGNMKTYDQLFILGYKEGKPCPECGTPIEKIKTGSTASFICPKCQI